MRDRLIKTLGTLIGAGILAVMIVPILIYERISDWRRQHETHP